MINSDADQIFPGVWVRAVLPTAILSCLRAGPLHGYGIALELERRGLGRLKGGSLYPALNKLEVGGDVTTAWAEGGSGPARRQYLLTGAGRARLAHEQEQWQDLLMASIGLPVQKPGGIT